MKITPYKKRGPSDPTPELKRALKKTKEALDSIGFIMLEGVYLNCTGCVKITKLRDVYGERFIEPKLFDPLFIEKGCPYVTIRGNNMRVWPSRDQVLRVRRNRDKPVSLSRGKLKTPPASVAATDRVARAGDPVPVPVQGTRGTYRLSWWKDEKSLDDFYYVGSNLAAMGRAALPSENVQLLCWPIARKTNQ